MTISVNVHRICSFNATTNASTKEDTHGSAWVTIYGVNQDGSDLIEVTFFTDGNQALAERIAAAINKAQKEMNDEDEIPF